MEKLLDRKLLLKKEELEVVRVDLGKDEFVYVKQWTGRERDNFEQSILKKNKDEKGVVIGFETITSDFRAKLCVVTICDKNGKLLLAPSDFALLSINMGARRLEKIVNAAQKLNAITEEDKEELIKNSVAGQAGSSPSDSVKSSK